MFFKESEKRSLDWTVLNRLSDRDRSAYQHMEGFNELNFIERSSDSQVETRVLVTKTHHFFEKNKLNIDGIHGLIQVFLVDERQPLSQYQMEFLEIVQTLVGRLSFYNTEKITSGDVDVCPKVAFDVLFEQNEEMKALSAAER